MALFGRKKKGETPAASEEQQVNQATDDSTLNLIKEAMEEEKAEKVSQSAGAEAQSSAQETDMPTAEEIRKAQEILARAKAAEMSANVQGVNAPINTANLKAVISNFEAEKSQANIKLVMDCLQMPQTLVCVPAQIITSPENQEKMKQGGEVKLEGPVHINPVILTDNNGKKVFPIFSGEDTMPDDLKKKTSKVNMPFAHCVNLLKNIRDVDAFALDPYTANIRINVNIQEKTEGK